MAALSSTTTQAVAHSLELVGVASVLSIRLSKHDHGSYALVFSIPEYADQAGYLVVAEPGPRATHGGVAGCARQETRSSPVASRKVEVDLPGELTLEPAPPDEQLTVLDRLLARVGVPFVSSTHA